MSEIIQLDINDIFTDIRANLRRAGWTKNSTKSYLIFTYQKDGVLKLTDEELLRFREFCRDLKTANSISLRELKIRTLPSLKDF